MKGSPDKATHYALWVLSLVCLPCLPVDSDGILMRAAMADEVEADPGLLEFLGEWQTDDGTPVDPTMLDDHADTNAEEEVRD